jgi:hypothetical protein
VASRGRAPELSVLDEALDRIASGRRCIVLIEGEAGIGKTRLLDAVLDDAAARGMQAMSGLAEELEYARPLACWPTPSDVRGRRRIRGGPPSESCWRAEAPRSAPRSQ